MSSYLASNNNPLKKFRKVVHAIIFINHINYYKSIKYLDNNNNNNNNKFINRI